MIIKDFNIRISEDNVLDILGCTRDNDIYGDVLSELRTMLPHAYALLEPVALVEIGEFAGRERGAVYCITSAGSKISEWSSQLFDDGEYLKGMLADAIADDYVFQIEHNLVDVLKDMCIQNHVGIIRRLEAPQDIDITMQRRALEITDCNDLAGITVNSSCMYYPVKTLCAIFETSDDIDDFEIEHDCTRCTNKECRFRSENKTLIKVVDDNRTTTLICSTGKTLYEVLLENGYFINAPCGGNGRCGKCGVKIMDKYGESMGYKLACSLIPDDGMIVVLSNAAKEKMSILSESSHSISYESDYGSDMGAEYGIAVDIGTTTIVMQLVEISSGVVRKTYTAINGQRVYGADVISRITASVDGLSEQLASIIRQQLIEGINDLTESGNIEIKRAIIAGNTTMIHLLMGYSCETLGTVPFTPVNIDRIHLEAAKIFDLDKYYFDIDVIPGISAFVGGDIVSGMYALDFHKSDKICILLDLGTNGEIAIGNKDRLLVSSMATGPAFEGGNIVCGTGSIGGAVCGVKIDGDRIRVETINNETPVGICGSGIIETVYELLNKDVIDVAGNFNSNDDRYLLTYGRDREEIAVYPKDIREIQLAKAAVRAGIETIISKYGVEYDEISSIYIAGGFGHNINIDKAIGIGLLPEVCRDRTESIV